MRYEVVLAPQAVENLRALTARARAEVRDGIERHLRQNPTRTSKSRIKRLRGMAQPQFRLRLGEIRVFYDVVEQTVQVLAIIGKEQASAWLEESGTPAPNRGAREDEG